MCTSKSKWKKGLEYRQSIVGAREDDKFIFLRSCVL